MHNFFHTDRALNKFIKSLNKIYNTDINKVFITSDGFIINGPIINEHEQSKLKTLMKLRSTELNNYYETNRGTISNI